jgi:putative Holliday junction resolvase
LQRRDTRAADFAEIQRLVDQERVIGVLVGLPLQGSGSAGQQARWTLRYAGRLAGVISVPVAFWDETLSSHDAEELMRHHARAQRDAIAAALILQDFLEARGLRRGSGDR